MCSDKEVGQQRGFYSSALFIILKGPRGEKRRFAGKIDALKNFRRKLFVQFVHRVKTDGYFRVDDGINKKIISTGVKGDNLG
jgi:hypothetical protein